MEIRELEDREQAQMCQGHDEEPSLMGEEATTFPRKGGQGEGRGPYSPRAAKVERKGGTSYGKWVQAQ